MNWSSRCSSTMHNSLDIVWSNAGTFNFLLVASLIGKSLVLLFWVPMNCIRRNYLQVSGQFFNRGTRIDKAKRQFFLPKRSPIPVNLEDPKPEVHHKSQCWRPQTPGYQGEGLIEGDYVKYMVDQ